ncbi:hypothetical protein [Streptomyces sp. NPDC018031]
MSGATPGRLPVKLPLITTDGRTARSGQGECAVEAVTEREHHPA